MFNVMFKTVWLPDYHKQLHPKKFEVSDNITTQLNKNTWAGVLHLTESVLEYVIDIVFLQSLDSSAFFHNLQRNCMQNVWKV